MTTKTRTSSPFATALRQIFESSPIYPTQAAWAEALEVRPAAASQWLSDTTLPSPDTLKSLVELLAIPNVADAEAIAEFRQILKRPREEVTPLNTPSGAATLRHYLVKVLFDGFLRALRPLPPERQEVVLRDATRQCRATMAAGDGDDLLLEPGRRLDSLTEVFRILRDRRWESILVIGDPYELKKESRRFRSALIYLFEAMELYGKPQLTYLVNVQNAQPRAEQLTSTANDYVKHPSTAAASSTACAVTCNC